MLNNIIELRQQLLKQHGLKLIRVFDTFENTSGEKDVSLCTTELGEHRILRIGEIRPQNFFLDGYEGNLLKIPKIFYRLDGDQPYEIEEYIEGRLAYEEDPEGAVGGYIENRLLEKLIITFWEFQVVGRTVALRSIPVLEKFEKHFEKSKHLIVNAERVWSAVNARRSFWEGQHPSKWKFALDNLILTPDGKVVFIDNANVGLRHFAYDLGWLIWPIWIQMQTELFMDPATQIKYLEHFLGEVQRLRPTDLVKDVNIEQAFWLTVLQRAVGALFDLENNTRHLANWKLDLEGDPDRRTRHIGFLNSIIDESLLRI